jgi:hypothetical protein
MKLHLTPVLAFLALTPMVRAQDDTALHRATYEKIDATEASFAKVTASQEEDETKIALTGWLADGEIKKIVAKTDDGKVDEFYLETEAPLFVFRTYRKEGDDGKKGDKIEERLYFKDGSIFKWLTTEKPAPVFHGEDYQATSELLVENCASYVAALKKDKPDAKVAAVQKTEGTFTGIEEGDYFHWQMKSKSGEEVSYFILKTDDSLDEAIQNAKSHIGKPCRVSWKKSIEDLPEAGGKTEIDVILSVEWLK